MEFSGKFGSRAGLLWLSFCILLALSCAKTEKPLQNVNLSPFWQWRSAYECLQNTSSKCVGKNLDMTGNIQVTGSELTDYCNGCKPWTIDVLNCIHSVKRDFWFSNNATIKQINDSINQGCSTKSDIVVHGFPKSSSMRNFSRTYMALFSALALAIFLFST
ncbi:hypothetical protein ACJRO7_004796 [Eucalyptus globulus]|uniref:DUF7731 domain-containing protein n=1 Tax=Eucalyptus globulus TaxID=34317 RepID=A0ABD3IXR5_EUCGL